jgi:hypothetical protein
MPTPQGEHTADPVAVATRPLAQGAHAALEVAPEAALVEVPTGQSAQAQLTKHLVAMPVATEQEPDSPAAHVESQVNDVPPVSSGELPCMMIPTILRVPESKLTPPPFEQSIGQINWLGHTKVEHSK